jgi:NADH-quinone oxidoreductase subunit E
MWTVKAGGIAEMIPADLKKRLSDDIAAAETPRERAVAVMYAFQNHYGYMSDAAMLEAAVLLGMTPAELEELATFYNFIYREPVGRYVIHICDSIVCHLHGYDFLMDHLCKRLDIQVGGTSRDGLFTLLPVCCIGFCDHAPAMLVNRVMYGRLTPEGVDVILEHLRKGEDVPTSPV